MPGTIDIVNFTVSARASRVAVYSGELKKNKVPAPFTLGWVDREFSLTLITMQRPPSPALPKGDGQNSRPHRPFGRAAAML